MLVETEAHRAGALFRRSARHPAGRLGRASLSTYTRASWERWRGRRSITGPDEVRGVRRIDEGDIEALARAFEEMQRLRFHDLEVRRLEALGRIAQRARRRAVLLDP
jgi:hypothetical protein